MATTIASTSEPAVQPNASPPSTRRRRFLRAETVWGWIFILPALVGFIAFYLLPTIRAFEIGLTNWNLLGAAKFVGFANYEKLFQDEKFWKSVWITALYVVYNIPAQTVLALLLAVLLDRFTKSVFVRTIMLVPYLISNVIVAMIWLWMLDPILGFVNTGLGALGFERFAFFSDTATALPSIAALNTWRHMGFTALLFYTGLSTIPRYLYESARIEGASEWRIFHSITLPLLRPTMVFVLVTSVIGSFQIFDTIAVTTQGGPANSTRTIVWYIYQTAFNNMRMGYASAMSCVLFIGLVLVTLVQMRVMRSGETDLE